MVFLQWSGLYLQLENACLVKTLKPLSHQKLCLVLLVMSSPPEAHITFPLPTTRKAKDEVESLNSGLILLCAMTKLCGVFLFVCFDL